MPLISGKSKSVPSLRLGSKAAMSSSSLTASPREAPSSSALAGGSEPRSGSALLQPLLDRLADDLATRDPDVDTMRRTVSRIQALIHTHEKCRKEIKSKKSNGISLLLQALEATADITISESIVTILSGIVSLGSKSALSLVNRGTVPALLRVLSSTQKTGIRSDQFAALLIGTLYELGDHDKKIGVGARLSGALAALIAIVKQNSGVSKIMVPALKLLTLVCNNSPTNIAVVGKSGGIAAVVGVFSTNRDPVSRDSSISKLALSLIVTLSCSKTNAAQLVEKDSVRLLLDAFRDLGIKPDKKKKINDARKSVLLGLKRLVSSPKGRKAFLESGGVDELYAFAKQVAELPESESLLTSIGALLRKCHPRESLPIPTDFATHTVPRDDGAVADDILGLDYWERFFPELGDDPRPPALSVQGRRPPVPALCRSFLTAGASVESILQPPFPEPFYSRPAKLQRSLVFADIGRAMATDVAPWIVYDDCTGPIPVDPKGDPCLIFESRFESGNLRRALKVSEFEYDLVLNTDINSPRHVQWFYFGVKGMKGRHTYKFNIVNCEKPNSQFNFGMQPVMQSSEDLRMKGGGWKRVGHDICYYKNHFTRASASQGAGDANDSDGGKGIEAAYYTLTFSIEFPYEEDTCHIAYHFPYTYSALQRDLDIARESPLGRTRMYRQTLCETIGMNKCDVITITSYDKGSIYPLSQRPYIFLSGRVHPGESNASWIMKGIIDFLLDDTPAARSLCDTFVFKIVPMLNPDGVINGNHRCSLSGQDLNRQWSTPSPVIHPTIFHTKRLLQFLVSRSRKPLVYCDLHGHSRKKNIFMYGCNDANAEYAFEQTFPRILEECSPYFSFASCRFNVDKSKESTARVVVWRELGILRSYTLESSYCGADKGQLKGIHFTTANLEEMGRHFCTGLLSLIDPEITERINGTLRQVPVSVSSSSADDSDSEEEEANRIAGVVISSGDEDPESPE